MLFIASNEILMSNNPAGATAVMSGPHLDSKIGIKPGSRILFQQGQVVVVVVWVLNQRAMATLERGK